MFDCVEQKGRCEILGHDGDAVTEFRIVLYPMLFFLNLTYDVQTVWFHKTITNTHDVMIFPVFEIFAQYVIYFPRM